MKANRTARRFIEEDQGKTVPGKPNLTIMTLRQYEAFVAKLAGEKKPSRFTPGQGSMDDKLRQWSRKQKMLLKDYEEKEFTPRDLTVTSHLVRLSARQIEKRFAHLRDTGRIISIPGSVTGSVRKSWNLLGCLAPACPEVMAMLPTLDKNRQLILDTEGKPSLSLQVRPKGEIRDITHLHHALDACVIGYASILLPNNGKLWEQIVTRKVRPSERIAFSKMHGWNKMLMLSSPTDSPTENTTLNLHVADLLPEYKKQIVERLKERRVVQHVPADMSGAHLEMTTWGVVKIVGDQVTLRQKSFGPKDIDPVTGARTRKPKSETVRLNRVVGLREGKLSKLKGAMIIADNFGMVLDPKPEVIPFHQVAKAMERLTKANGGRTPRILKNGMVLKVTKPEARAGIWRIVTMQESSLKVDFVQPDLAQFQVSVVNDEGKSVKRKVSGSRVWREVSIQTLLNGEFEILSGKSYCGFTAS